MNASFRTLLVVGLLAATPLAAPRTALAAAGPLCYVDIDAGGASNGNSWADAYTGLQLALADANCEEIWVAEGLYRPVAGADQSISFNIGASEEVYGGFAGMETQRDQRDPAANITILSGDLTSNDVNGDGNSIAETSADIVAPNSYHVVRIDGTAGGITTSTVLDGFVITAGRADALFNDKGGGLYCDGSGNGNVCNPTLSQLTFSGNWAWYGGGLHNNGSSGGNASPTITDVIFTGNNNGGTGSGTAGGGMYNDANLGTSGPQIQRVLFQSNGNAGTTNGGGGMYNDGSGGGAYPVIQSTTFIGNAALFGGGLAHSGGDSGNLSLAGVTFYGNSANNAGGAIFQSGEGSLYNGILWGNTAVNLGPQIYGDENMVIVHSDIQGSGGSGGSWNAGLGLDGGGNLDADPMLGALLDNGGYTRSMAIPADSPALDAGDDTTCLVVDQRRVSRPRGPHCDMGAFEHIPPVTDFDGDDKADPAKFVPGTGWAWWYRSGTAGWEGISLGGDVAQYVGRSDFDGDGKTEPAKYVATGQSLWYTRSSDAGVVGVYMGSGTYSILPGGDYDGDQKTDPAKYLGSAGSVWWLPSGGGGWAGTFIGMDAAPALPGSDYDGDGKTDLAKYVPGAGAIWYFGSLDSAWHGVYIGSDGTPVPASDFDGDGITDMAKYLTGSNALWWRSSNSGTWSGVFLGPGSFTYIPAGDFDGDGKTDPAKFDTVGKGLWWLPSTTGVWASLYMGGETYSIVN